MELPGEVESVPRAVVEDPGSPRKLSGVARLVIVLLVVSVVVLVGLTVWMLRVRARKTADTREILIRAIQESELAPRSEIERFLDPPTSRKPVISLDGGKDVSKFLDRRSTSALKREISVDFQNADLRDVMDNIGRRVGKNIVVDPETHETVTISLKNIPWRDAVDVIAKMARCEVEQRGAILVVGYPRCYRIEFDDADVRTVIELLVGYSGCKVVVSPEVKGTVTIRHYDERWFIAIAQALGKTGLRGLRVGDTVYVDTQPRHYGFDLPGDAPSLEGENARDAWGNPILYRFPGKAHPDRWEVYSMGPNGQDDLGEGDDIVLDLDAPKR